MQEKIALFGGSFDPVHSAHKDIIEKLSRRFDRVIVMPAAISPFKKDETCADGTHRVEMLRRCVRGMENVKVSRYELKKAGVSYTAETVAHLSEKYPGAEVYTVIGSEEIACLDKWHDADFLKRNTVFYAVERPQAPVTARLLAGAEKQGFRVAVAPFVGMDVSSSEVKLERAFYGDDLPVPKPVAKYIEKNGLYADYRCITDRYEEFGLKKERVLHIKRTAAAAINLAKRYGVSCPAALTAALLHDIGKETDEDFFARHDLTAPSEARDMPPQIRHAEYGAVIAKQCFGIEDEEILEAIRLHTTGDAGMSELTEVIFLADCIEEGRETCHAQNIRLSARESLKKGMLTALGSTVEYLNETGEPVYPRTLAAYEYYKRAAEKADEESPCAAADKAAKKRAVKKSQKSMAGSAPDTAESYAAADKPKLKSGSAKDKKEGKAVPKKKAAAEMTAQKAEKDGSEQPAAQEEKEQGAQASVSGRTVTALKQEEGGAAYGKTGLKLSGKATQDPHEQAHDLAYTIGQLLGEKKALDVNVIDVSQRTVIADYFVIAGATSTTQVRALADYVDEKLSKNYGIEPRHRDVDAKWYVVDYGSVIVHVFYDEFRKFYQLERLWSDGTNVEYIDTDKN